MQAELIDRAVEHIADGQAVNWDLLDSHAHDEADRQQLKWLRVLEEIAHLHRSTVDPLDSVAPGEATADEHGPAEAAAAADGVEHLGRRFAAAETDPNHVRMAAADIAAPDIAAPDIADPNIADPDVADPDVAYDGTRKAAVEGRVAPAPAHRPVTARASSATSGVTTGAAVGAASVPTWGRYHLLDKVGEGSFGAVYRAWDPQLEREIAIKILHRHLTDERLRQRLLREGRALAKIRQANVVSVFGVESHEDRIGLCMEFVQGQTLEDVLRAQGTLNARETVLVGEDICRALAAVHNAGFVHRDVKARNVMREQGGRIVLMDFGTGREARVLEEAKRPDVVGTPLYMAPEVLAGETASARSDVYSVGVLLYHLVTSGYPIKSHSVDDLRAAHREGRRTFLSESRPDLPMAFVRVIERALATNPEERHANAGALLNALGNVLDPAERATFTIPTIKIPRSVLTVAKLAVLVACVPLALGMLNSAAFNLTLGRSGFSTETLVDSWVWGFRLMVLPTVVLMVSCLVIAPFAVIPRVLRGVSSTAARFDDDVRSRLRAWAHRLSLDHAPTLASLVLVLSASALGWLLWYFNPVIAACAEFVSTGSVDVLAPLAPHFARHHVRYLYAFSWLVVLTGAAWYVVLRLAARRQQRMNRAVLLGGAGVLAVSILALDLPYRLLKHNEFEAATWNGHASYIIGERTDEVLLFVPGLEPPRKREVRKNGVDTLQRLGRYESIYTPFAPVARADSTTGTR